MAESLGDALLSLRTDDTQFNAGVTRAEGKARALGGTLDKTSGSATRLSTGLTGAGRSADAMGVGFERGGQRILASAGAQRAGMLQLGQQVNDVATMYALGARPTQIFASQIGQVTQAINLATGGTSKLARFLGGPWGIALTAATVVLAPFIAKLFEAEDALEAVEFSSDAMADAQGILGGVMDLTTGKINTQSEALLALARAQAIAGRVGAQQRQEEARRELGDIAKGELNVLGSTGSLFNRGELRRDRDPASFIAERVLAGELKPAAAIEQLDRLSKAGEVTKNSVLGALEAIANLGVETENIKVFEELGKALDGDDSAIGQFLKPEKTKRSSKGPSEEDIQRRFEGQLTGITQQILRTRIALATSAEERAELEARSVEWDRIQTVAEIEADEKFNALQKDELVAAATRLADAELLAIERSKRVELERDAQQLSDQQYEAQRDALQLQFTLADTEAERKRIALEMLAAEEAYLRSRLQSVILSDTANDAERLRAQAALAALDASAAQRRESVARANETSVERFMRELNRSPAQLSEAVDKITIDGLEAFNDELVDAILNAKSLGDVFKSVANQIIADLLRIAIQQALIKPLAESLFGGGGGGGGLGGLLGGLFGGGFSLSSDVTSTINNPEFAGLFASGGLIPKGQFGIVGERGPEPVFSTPGGAMVLPNSALRGGGGAGGGTQVSIPISIDAAGADPAALERVRAQVAQLQRELPAIVVRTVQDAGDRRIFTTRNFR